MSQLNSKRMPSVPEHCETCGKSFRVAYKRKDTARYCSVACYRNPFSVKRICTTCRMSYRVPIGRAQSRFCSRDCQGLARRRRVIVTCESCGDSLEVTESRAIGFRFCSRDCQKSFGRKPFIDKRGYVMVYAPTNAMAQSTGYVGEHRLVMSEIIGRPIADNEVVHHIDENRANNVPDNLQLMTRSEHTLLHKPKRPKR
jgi:hypothetical protein